MKQLLKRAIFGSPGVRRVKRGIAKGLRFRTDPQAKAQRLLGLDEYEIASDFRRLASRSASFVDIGASDGYYLAIARKINPRIQCVGYDGNASMADIATENLTLNFGPEFAKSWRAGCVGAWGDPLDTITQGMKAPLFLKVDVDGGELDVLRTGMACLAMPTTSLILETHSKPLEDEAIELLRGLGKAVRIIPQGRLRWFIPEHRPTDHNRWLVAETIP